MNPSPTPFSYLAIHNNKPHTGTVIAEADASAVPVEENKPKKRSGPRSKSSPYKGVTQYRRTGKWEAHIWIPNPRGRGQQRHLGSYHTAEDAARCFDRATIRIRGPDEELNFPVEDYEEDPFMIENANTEKMRFLELLRQQFSILPETPHIPSRRSVPPFYPQVRSHPITNGVPLPPGYIPIGTHTTTAAPVSSSGYTTNGYTTNGHTNTANNGYLVGTARVCSGSTTPTGVLPPTVHTGQPLPSLFKGDGDIAEASGSSNKRKRPLSSMFQETFPEIPPLLDFQGPNLYLREGLRLFSHGEANDTNLFTSDEFINGGVSPLE